MIGRAQFMAAKTNNRLTVLRFCAPILFHLNLAQLMSRWRWKKYISLFFTFVFHYVNFRKTRKVETAKQKRKIERREHNE